MQQDDALRRELVGEGVEVEAGLVGRVVAVDEDDARRLELAIGGRRDELLRRHAVVDDIRRRRSSPKYARTAAASFQKSSTSDGSMK